MMTSWVDTETLFSATRVYLRNMSAVISRMYRVDSITASDVIYIHIIQLHLIFTIHYPVNVTELTQL